MDSNIYPKPSLRTQAVFSVLFFITILTLLRSFAGWLEMRSGAVVSDPILAWFDPINVAPVTFLLVYGAIGFMFYSLRNDFPVILAGVRAYSVLLIMRMVTIYCLPLDPPATLIPLKDPIVEFFATGNLITKDLFFSGHTASPLLYSFFVKSKSAKITLWIFTGLIAACVLIQHVHYTIDVLAAPFFAYGVVCISRYLDQKIMPILAKIFR